MHKSLNNTRKSIKTETDGNLHKSSVGKLYITHHNTEYTNCIQCSY